MFVFAVLIGGIKKKKRDMQGIILALEIVAIYVIFGPVVLLAVYIIFDRLANRTPNLTLASQNSNEQEDDPALWGYEDAERYLKKRKLSTTSS